MSGHDVDSLPPPGLATPGERLHVENLLYGGDAVVRNAAGEHTRVPFVLPGEWIAVPATESPAALEAIAVLQPSPARVTPPCVHFGQCGGCQYQMASYPAQLELKQGILLHILAGAGLSDLPQIQEHGSSAAFGYRNRIRLRLRLEKGAVRLGYTRRNTQEFLPVTMCPIAAPLLWRAAEALMRLGSTHRDVARWCATAAEAEFFCSPGEDRLQITLLCGTKPPPDASASFGRCAEALRSELPELAGAGAARWDARTGRVGATFASWGTAGLPYPVLEQTYWVTRGGFFQVNRFLLPRLVELVCGTDSGTVAWDLFAGVGLFSRVLAQRFQALTAVEANPVAAQDLRAALRKAGAAHRAVEATTLTFLQAARLQRERPELVLLDPPRAGAGEESCTLLAELRPRQIRYLSCDPTTLARDLRVLTHSGYSLAALHLIDLFPQTYHLETLAVLNRTS